MNHTQEINLSRYYLNKKARENGKHELHKSDCNRIPGKKTYIDLGIHMNYKSAIVKALDYFRQLNCCGCCTNNSKPN